MTELNYSVLMSVYCKENPKYFEKSILSMLEQTIPPSEIILVKDGPLPMELNKVIDNFSQKHRSLFNVVELEKNIGLGLALNEGLRASNNELVARMDTDDISLPERCELQLKEFEKDQLLDIVGTMVDEFYDDPLKPVASRILPTQHDEIVKFAKRRSPFNHPTVMYKKSKVLSSGGYADLRRNQDVDLFARMLFAGCRAKNIDKSLVLFRSNADLLKRRRSWENTKSYIATIGKLWKLGFSSFTDYAIVAIAQTIMFISPISIQKWLYKNFLRK